MTEKSDDLLLWRIKVIDQALAEGEMSEDEAVEALLEALELNREYGQDADAQLEGRLREFESNQQKMRSPLMAALLCGNPVFERFLAWSEGEVFDSEAQEIPAERPQGNFLTDSYDSEGNMLPPWQVFPDTPLSSMQWSLGSGASYLTVFGAWFQGLDMASRQQYLEKYPAPESFRDLYLFKDLL